MNPRLKKFLSYYVKYKKQFAKVMLCALVSSAASLLMPLCTRRIAELATGAQNIGAAIIRTGLLMIALLAVEALFNYYYDYYGHALGARMESDLRAELFAHLERMSFAFFDGHKIGHLMSSLTNDMLNLTELFHHGPEDYVMNIVRLAGATAILATINARLALVVLIFVPIIIAGTLYWGKRVRKVSGENQARVADINSYASDVLGGIRTVQAYTQEDAQRRRFDKAGEAFYKSRCAVYLTESYGDKTTLILVRLTTIAVIICGGLFVTWGTLDLAGLIAFIMYVSYVTEPITRLSWMVTQYQTGMAGFDRVMTLLETEPGIDDAPDAVPAQNLRGELALRDVTFAYADGEKVLDGLSLDVPAGQFIALVGMSGKGKSTLGALLPRFYEPQSGEIILDGRDVRGYTLDSLRQSVTLVLQDAYLFDDTVAENIRIGRPDASPEDVTCAAKLADADGFISALPNGYDSLVGERGVKLSGGQRQRIGVARAFLKNAPVLILDEATSSLDNTTERNVYASLRKLRKGMTTIVIAHRLSTIRDAERIVVLEGGRIIEDGTHERLMAADGAYAALYRKQGFDANEN